MNNIIAVSEDSRDPRLLIKAAYQHWCAIGWPEDRNALILLERAIDLLEPAIQPTIECMPQMAFDWYAEDV